MLSSGTKPSAIEDPIKDAGNKYHLTFTEKERICPWEKWMSCLPTWEFDKLDQGYVRHCGPTAITNVVLAMDKRYHILHLNSRNTEGQEEGDLPKLNAQAVFRMVSAVGKHNLAYWNVDLLGKIGGTSDSLSGWYLHRVFKKFGIKGRIRDKFALKPDSFRKSIEKGNILYLQLHRHPLYGSHHLLCYGVVELESVGALYRKTYLIVADGWVNRPRYLDAADLKLGHYLEISLSK